jgi:two-component system, chemotaxis family, protein-glutamate methylesterase/glutaminase
MSTPSTSRIRVLVVDDSAVARRLVSQALSAQPDMEVIGFAENGRVALERVAEDLPDAVVLDLEMPEMDGIAALRELKLRHAQLPVLVFSSRTQRGAGATVDALLAGADDYALKPSSTSATSASWATAQVELTEKLRAVTSTARRLASRTNVSAPPLSMRPLLSPRVPLKAVVIGTSAGGPEALSVILPRLPADLRVPLLIVQHMPASFTAALAKRLSEKSRLRVVEARPGLPVEPGVAYLAPGDFHLRVSRRHGAVMLLLDQGPLEHGCRPAVDPLFRSAAGVYGPTLLALVLTGMGSDGVEGARKIGEAGGHVWVQDQQSSMIWGMAGAVASAGLARRTLPLSAMAGAVELAIGAGLPLSQAPSGGA